MVCDVHVTNIAKFELTKLELNAGKIPLMEVGCMANTAG